MRFLVGAPIVDFEVRSIGKPVGGTSSDKFTLTMSFRTGRSERFIILQTATGAFQRSAWRSSARIGCSNSITFAG